MQFTSFDKFTSYGNSYKTHIESNSKYKSYSFGNILLAHIQSMCPS